MVNKEEISPRKKLAVVRKINRGDLGPSEAARRLGVHVTAVRRWVSLYKRDGAKAFRKPVKPAVYTDEQRKAAVLDYLSGGGSLRAIALKHGLRAEIQLRRWILRYNTHGDLQDARKGGHYMGNVRKTTFEERLEIVKLYLDGGQSYSSIALKYKCSYQQVRNWVQKYKKMGAAGLEDRRGRRAGSQTARTPEEKDRDEKAAMRKRIHDLELENAYLKKVRELAMKHRYR